MTSFNPMNISLPKSHFIGGHAVDEGEQREVLRPSDGQVYGAFFSAGLDLVDRAVENAWTAFKESDWAKQAPRDRAKVMKRWADLIDADVNTLAPLEAVGSTRPISAAAQWDVPFSAIGLVAAAASGWWDAVISRIQDALISIPSKMFALVMVASFGSSVPLLILTAAIAYMPGSFRIARSLAVNVMTMDYIQVARLRGESMPYIIFKEVLPNMIRPVMTDFGLRFVFIVLLLSSMSFLGLGIQPPAADWGSLVRENILGLAEGAPAVIAPAIAIATLTIGTNLLIDSFGGELPDEK